MKPSDKKKNKTGNIKIKPGSMEIDPKEWNEVEETDHDSTTNDPTQPDTEISHSKKHKIGDPVKPIKKKTK